MLSIEITSEVPPATVIVMVTLFLMIVFYVVWRTLRDIHEKLDGLNFDCRRILHELNKVEHERNTRTSVDPPQRIF